MNKDLFIKEFAYTDVDGTRVVSADTAIACMEERDVLYAENKKLREQVNVLIGHVIKLSDDAWPYLHHHCTIESIKIRWKNARDYIQTI